MKTQLTENQKELLSILDQNTYSFFMEVLEDKFNEALEELEVELTEEEVNTLKENLTVTVTTF